MIRLLILPLILLAATAARAEMRPPMVAAAHPLAAEAGMNVLRDGGSAVDAAIAVQAVLTLVEPQSSGIGGGAFMLHYGAADGRIDAYDGRETAPASAGPDLFLGDDGQPLGFFEAVVGGRSVGAPGVLRMLELAHGDHGRLPWGELFDDAIRLSRDGFEVTPRLHYLLDRDRFLKASPTAAPHFYNAEGEAWPVGHVLKNPTLADTLTQIAEGGADAFYEGPLARDVVAAVQGHAGNPGLLTEADLAGYEAKRREPVCIEYRSDRVCGMPPPTSGGVTVAQILGMLSRFDLANAGPAPVLVHLVAEAEKRAYADRARFLADSDFVDVPVAELLNPDYLARRADGIDITAATGKAEPGLPRRGDRRAGRDLKPPSTTTADLRRR